MPQSLDEILGGQKKPSLDEILGGQQPEQPPTPGIKGYLGSAGRGVLGMLASKVSGPGQYEEMMGTGGQKSTVPSQQEYFKQFGGEQLPRAGGFSGALTEGITEAATDPISWLGPGGLGQKALGIGSSVFGSELMQYLMPNTPGAGFAGGVLGGGAAGVPGAARRAASRIATPIQPRPPSPSDLEHAQHVQTLRQHGIEPSAGDVIGSMRLRKTEETGSLPLGGTSYQRVKREPEQQLTDAVLREIGETGQHGRVFNDNVFKESGDRLGREFNSVAHALPIEATPKMENDLFSILFRMHNAGMDDDVQRRITALVDRLLPSPAGPRFGDLWEYRANGTQFMPGERYQNFTKYNEDLSRAIRDPNPNVSFFGTLVRSALDDALESQATASGNTQALERLQTARRQWYNRLVAFSSVSRRGEAAGHGQINPGTLVTNLTSGQDAKMTFAAQRSNLHRLAKAADAVMTPYRELGFGGTHETGIRGTTAGVGGLAGTAIGHAIPIVGAPTGALSGAIAGWLAPGGVGRLVNNPGVQGWLKGNTRWQNILRQKGLLQPKPSQGFGKTLAKTGVRGYIGSQAPLYQGGD